MTPCADPNRGSRHPILEGDLDRILANSLPWEQFAGKTVLVTGAGGFLPAYLVETLLRLNETRTLAKVRVVGLVRNLKKAQERFRHHAGRSDLDLVCQDVIEPWNLEGRMDFIIHAASQASPKFFGSDPVGTLEANLLGTRRALLRAREDRTEGFLYFSSGEVYGQVDPARIPILEDAYGYLDPTNVRACYGEGKRAGEALCVAYAHQFGIPARIARPFHTYGPGMALDDGRVFADFVSNIVLGQDLVLKSEGLAVRPFCYLADATVGFFTVLLKGSTGAAYNVGNPDTEISIRDLAALLVRVFPEPQKRVVVSVQPHSHGYLESPIVRNSPDIRKLRALGWNPTTGLVDGFTRTVNSFLNPSNQAT
ncbi:NAD-dependent epimerase/dehydratase family protein [Geothrix sp. 21YS21S-2]|uniref:NAD-dependent epimerase/dehydratase family protein n=1 Tax=Geothrix sp. 21YS21S-2 TaxID=3068893 RepID=UPI0027B9A6B5|nr:NAD-dependent epimerase/dehydratase family protein [Geothrix sp. 21YS21S-2]